MCSGTTRRSTYSSTMRPRPLSRRPNIYRSVPPTRSLAPRCMARCIARWLRESVGSGLSTKGWCSLSILSTSTITGRAFTVPSAMAKSAILAMTKSLAVEWGPKGIRTVAIAPGAFPTEGASGQLRPEGRDEGWAQRNPLGRAGEHRELADLASFLISDQAGYINGEMVVQDGGAHLRSSGAEDLLQWTDAQWEEQRAARSKG